MSRLIVGVRRERMPGEGRIPLFPETMALLRRDLESAGVVLGFIVESGLGQEVDLDDSDWRAEAIVTSDLGILYESADIVLGVKQATWEEVGNLRQGQGLSCFYHVNANREVVKALLAKGVKILPLERHRPSLSAMSREAGKRIPDVLDRCYQGDWRKENFFFLGARGTVCRHAIDAVLGQDVKISQISAFDLEAGPYTACDVQHPTTYETFSVADGDQMRERLQISRIIVLAALGRDGVAPKIITSEHLGILPHESLIVQVSIDEGGNIDDERFCRVTYWDDPVYEVRLGPKALRVCNVPDIPGCIRPEGSSRALEMANYDYYVKIFQAWPNIPEGYLLTQVS